MKLCVCADCTDIGGDLHTCLQAYNNRIKTDWQFPLRSCVIKKGVSLSCCIKDESRSLGFGDQELEPNRPMRHSLRVFVVSDKGKGNQRIVRCVLRR